MSSRPLIRQFLRNGSISNLSTLPSGPCTVWFGRSIVISAPAFTATGRDEAELAAAIRATKHQIAFYASTPAYASVLELHGWQDLGTQANGYMRAGRFDDLHELVDDEVLRTISVVGDPASCGRQLRERYAGTVDRISCYTTYESDPSLWPAVLEAARQG